MNYKNMNMLIVVTKPDKRIFYASAKYFYRDRKNLVPELTDEEIVKMLKELYYNDDTVKYKDLTIAKEKSRIMTGNIYKVKNKLENGETVKIFNYLFYLSDNKLMRTKEDQVIKEIYHPDWELFKLQYSY